MRNRDEEEFTAFATAAAGRLRRTAYLMCGDWHRAEDATQDTLVRMYSAWARVGHNPGVLAVYSHKTLVNVVLDQGRRRWRQERVIDTGSLELGATSPDVADAIEVRRLVVAALSRLPDRQRACVVLRHYADLSLEDAAQALGISTGAVKSQASRGLARLRELIEADADADPSERTLSWT